MGFEKVKLNVNGRGHTCNTMGNLESDHIFLTLGPGSLYFPIYSDKLLCNVQFIAFDSDWIYTKGGTVDRRAIEAKTMDSMVAEVAAAVAVLNAKYPGKKIHLLANSVVSKLALSCAEKISGIDSTICIGTPMGEIDANFTAARAAMQSANPAKAKQFGEDQARYLAMMNGKRLDEKMPESNVASGRLTPNSDFNEQSRSLECVLLAKPENATHTRAMWRNVWGNKSAVINPLMRDHFFGPLQATVDTPTLLAKLDQAGKRVLLCWGEQDRLTPPPNSEQLDQYKNIKMTVFPNAGHFPQLEARDGEKNFDDFVLRKTGVKAAQQMTAASNKA